MVEKTEEIADSVVDTVTEMAEETGEVFYQFESRRTSAIGYLNGDIVFNYDGDNADKSGWLYYDTADETGIIEMLPCAMQ